MSRNGHYFVLCVCVPSNSCHIFDVADNQQPYSPATPPDQQTSSAAAPVTRRIMVVAVVGAVAFLCGFLPGWLKSRAATSKLNQAQRELQSSQILNKLASAAIDARRGEYEPARKATSQFFTELRAALDANGKSLFTSEQRVEANRILNQRDDIITLLARSDPAAANKLTDMYVAYRKLVAGG